MANRASAGWPATSRWLRRKMGNPGLHLGDPDARQVARGTKEVHCAAEEQLGHFHPLAGYLAGRGLLLEVLGRVACERGALHLPVKYPGTPEAVELAESQGGKGIRDVRICCGESLTGRYERLLGAVYIGVVTKVGIGSLPPTAHPPVYAAVAF